MENNRKGICINAGNCRQADNKIKQEISIAADFVCSECGRDLIPVEEKRNMKLSKPMLIAIPILVLLLGGAGYAWYYYSKAKAVVEITENAINKTTDIILNDTKPIPSLANVIRETNIAIGEEQKEDERKHKSETAVATYKKQAEGDAIAMYELCKTIIYGKGHHEAFEQLEKASEIAIEQDKASLLLNLIWKDIEEDKKKPNVNDRTIWRLTTEDHKNHWVRIVMALSKNDASLLHKKEH